MADYWSSNLQLVYLNFSKKKIIFFDLNSGIAHGTGFYRSYIFRVLLRTLSRDIRIEDCESWFVPFLVLLPRLNRIKTNWKFSGLRADRRRGAGRLWFSRNPLTSCSNEFSIGCNWTRQRDRFNTISTLLCRSMNSLHNVLGVLSKNGWRY